MSSYLNFYLVPKKETIEHSFDEEKKEYIEVPIKLSEGKPLLFMSISRASDIYTAFHDSLNVQFIGDDDEPKYEDLTMDKINTVIADWKEEIDSTQSRLDTDYRMLKAGAKVEELWEDIHDCERCLHEQKDVLKQLEGIKFWVFECCQNYNQFEKILINID